MKQKTTLLMKNVKNYLLGLFVLLIFVATQSFDFEKPKYHSIRPVNSGGPANAGNGGRTGAPGDFGLCSDCHGGGSFAQPNITLTVTDAGGGTITSYVPGTQYNVSFLVSAASGSPRFGMQATSLKSTNVSAGVFSLPSSNARISPSGSRTYFEQSATSTSGTFTGKWTAPAAGSGPVTFYYIGNVVNGTGNTAGDNPTAGKSLTLTEGLSVDNFDFKNSIKILQNPIKDNVSIEFDQTHSKLELSIYDITGKKVFESNYSNTDKINIDSKLNSGVYIINITNENNLKADLKLIKK
jgi:hypothetical protein